ncbi:MAG: 5'-methylthioadenosine/S-adenosylhomocysteine nucleosidase [Buchananella hordeovulneris]|nr:5'-methylthioadenosine/S-adenosylhomocysteine nucleosidase [Buchananella hordeovulneris]
MNVPAAIVVVAMSEEGAPFLAAAESSTELPLRCRAFELSVPGGPVWLVQCGIGMVAAAKALTQALEHLAVRFPGTRIPVISAGTAGGLGEMVEVRDVCVSRELAYSEADARVFGYELGQLPGQPARFHADAELVDTCVDFAAEVQGDLNPSAGVFFGLMLTGNSFVMADTAQAVRDAFPGAISVDMESVALAQVARDYELPFVSVRGVSDLCGPAAGQDFHVGADVAAARSAAMVLELIRRRA